MVPKKHSNPQFPCEAYSITPQYLAMKIAAPTKWCAKSCQPFGQKDNVIIIFQLVQDFVQQQDIPIIHFSNNLTMS